MHWIKKKKSKQKGVSSQEIKLVVQAKSRIFTTKTKETTSIKNLQNSESLKFHIDNVLDIMQNYPV